MFLLRTCCAFGIEGYFVHSQATESFGGCAMAEYSFTVYIAVKQDQNVHHHRDKDIKLWLSRAILYLLHQYKPYKLPYSIKI